MGCKDALLLPLGIVVLGALFASGCTTRAPVRAERTMYLAQSMTVDCKPGESSVVCCIKKYPATASESCGATASEVADVLNSARTFNQAAKDGEEEDTDDFANNALLPEWKQECIRRYVDCKNEDWTGNCHDCIRSCEGQREWPFSKCRERRQKASP